MSATPITLGVTPGIFYEQPGAEWTRTQWGFDEGHISWETHPQTSVTAYPQRYQRHPFYNLMFATSITPRRDASGIIVLDAHYRGLLSTNDNKQRLLPGADAQMWNLPVLSSGAKLNLVVPVPKDKLIREYLTTDKPTLSGVGATISGAAFLPAPASFSLSYIADPDTTPSKNYQTGWVLDNRTWEDIAEAVYLVREFYSYYYSLASS